MANRCGTVTRNGGAGDVVAWQSGTARLLPRLLAGRRKGPVFLHAAEDGASMPMLMRMSGHTSIRSLGKYARPSAEALIKWQASTDPAARRRG